jgi:hypothetical protein
MDTILWEKLAVLDIASGTLCQNTDGCMDDIATHYQNMCDAESQESLAVEKRFMFINKWVEKAWHIGHKHIVEATTLGVLGSVVSAAPGEIIRLGRSAICGKEGNGNQGCISWAGGIKAMRKAVALEIIGSAKGAFGEDAVSGEEYAAVFGKSSKVKRKAHDVCISNRPNGCT